MRVLFSWVTGSALRPGDRSVIMAALVLDDLVLSASRRPELLESEIELCWVQSADLEFDKHKGETWRNGTLAVTSHRLLWLKPEHDSDRQTTSSAPARDCSLPLSSIKGHRGVNSFFKKTPRVILSVWRSAEGRPACAEAAQAEELDEVSVALRGPSGSYDTMEKNLTLALSRQEWKRAPVRKTGLTVGETYALATERQRGATSSARVGASAAGIGGLVRKQREDNLRADKSIDGAFKDLAALMDKAREMVDLSAKLKEALRENAESADDTNDEDKGIEKFLLTLGITSVVTKTTAGSMFHQQLSQQLSDFLEEPLKKSSGALALVDVYCIFNRARGIELVSPEDLIEAAALFPKIGAGMRLRKFESGTLAIQSSEHSDEALYEKLEAMAQEGGKPVGIGPDDVAGGLDIPLILAREYLLMAEQDQVLCRDDGPDGLRFYRNFFRDLFEY